MSGISNIIEIINAKTAEKEKEIIEEAEKHKKTKLEDIKLKISKIFNLLRNSLKIRYIQNIKIV